MFKTGTQLRVDHQLKFKISTGSAQFDAVLGGGIESKSLTEIYGEYRTGKTQLFLTMCVTAQLNEKKGGKVIFVDTEGSFSPDRLKTICERFNVVHETVLDNIIYARIHTVDQQEKIPEMIEAQIDQDSNSPYAAIILDSLMSLYRCDFSGRGELSERQQHIAKHLNQLRKLSERHNLAVVYSNHVMSDPSGGLTFVSDPKKPVGGHVVAHASTTRIMLKKGRETERIARVVDSPTLPEADATFNLSEQGVGDC